MDGWSQKSFNHILRDWKTEGAVSNELKESLGDVDSHDQVCLPIFICGLRIHMLHDTAVNNVDFVQDVGHPALIIFAPKL